MHVAVLAALKPRSVRLFGEWGRSVWRRVGPALRNGASTEGAAVSKLDEASQELKEPWEAETGMQTRVHVTGRRRDIPGGGAEPERVGGQPGCTEGLNLSVREASLAAQRGAGEQAGAEACGAGREVPRASFRGLSSLGKCHSVPVSK